VELLEHPRSDEFIQFLRKELLHIPRLAVSPQALRKTATVLLNRKVLRVNKLPARDPW
jgi:hypothetical protein